jgi:hypothetical protein
VPEKKPRVSRVDVSPLGVKYSSSPKGAKTGKVVTKPK